MTRHAVLLNQVQLGNGPFVSRVEVSDVDQMGIYWRTKGSDGAPALVLIPWHMVRTVEMRIGELATSAPGPVKKKRGRPPKAKPPDAA